MQPTTTAAKPPVASNTGDRLSCPSVVPTAAAREASETFPHSAPAETALPTQAFAAAVDAVEVLPGSNKGVGDGQGSEGGVLADGAGAGVDYPAVSGAARRTFPCRKHSHVFTTADCVDRPPKYSKNA